MSWVRNGIAGIVLLTCCAVAASEEPSYSHIELRRENAFLDIEEGSQYHLDSFGIAASWQVVNHMSLQAEGKRTNVNGDEFNSYRAGITSSWSIFGITDFYALGAYNFGAKQADAGIGLRARPAREVEFNVYFGSDAIESAEHSSTETGVLEFGIRFYPTRALAVGFDHSRTVVGDDRGHFNRFSIRYDFAGLN